MEKSTPTPKSIYLTAGIGECQHSDQQDLLEESPAGLSSPQTDIAGRARLMRRQRANCIMCTHTPPDMTKLFLRFHQTYLQEASWVGLETFHHSSRQARSMSLY